MKRCIWKNINLSKYPAEIKTDRQSYPYKCGFECLGYEWSCPFYVNVDRVKKKEEANRHER